MDVPVVLAQYKLAVDMADRVSARRNSTSAFFLSGITALTVINGFVGGNSRVLASIVCGSTVLLCAIWYFALSGYRRLNEAKFAVIQEVEQHLPFQLFADEEAYYKGERPAPPSSMTSKYRHRWRPLSRTEQSVPVLFGVVSVVVLVARMVWTG